MYDWKLSLLWEYRWTFAEGLRITFYLTAVSVLAGTIIGYILGILLSLKGKIYKPLHWLINIYIVFFGWLPLLVLLVWMYYFLPVLLDIRISALMISYIALSLNLSAFIADIVRGAIAEIPKSYIEAGRAVGMSYPLVLKRIMMPEVARSSLPSLVALYINQFKWTSLCSVIGVQELLHNTDAVMIQTYRSLEAYTAIAVIYLVVIGMGNLLYFKIQKMDYFKQKA